MAAAWLGAPLSIVLACGATRTETDAGGPGQAPPIALADLCGTFTADLCGYLLQCAAAPYCDTNHCVAENECYGVAQLAQAVSAGAISYDPNAAGRCAAGFRADPCHFGFFLFTPTIFDVLAHCPGTLAPHLKSGDPCAFSSECGSGLYCYKINGDCPGTCRSWSAVGDTCVGSLQCAPGSMCGAQSVCQRDGAEGTSCKSTADCGPTILCFGDPSCQSPNLWCDTAVGTCKPGVATGAACGATPAGQVACAVGLWCDAITVDMEGTCRASGGAGAPCNDQGGCDQALHCVGYQPVATTPTLGRCLPLQPAGGSCEINGDCAVGLACLGGSCGAPLAVGSRCNSDSDCQAGFTCTTEKCLRAACPGQACSDPNSACVSGLCSAGLCVTHAKLGQPCALGAECTTGACSKGACIDTSVCANP